MTTNTFSDYKAARAEAERRSRDLDHATYVEAAREYGRPVYRVGLLPNDPAKRFGFELRVEAIERPAVKS